MAGHTEGSADGIYVEGPFPADTVFRRVEKDKFDGIINMYHDQGQVATKLLGFERGVTLHGGMPVPITTPAHGTAFGRAGENRADATAIIRAFQIVCQLAGNKRSNGCSMRSTRYLLSRSRSVRAMIRILLVLSSHVALRADHY